MELGSHWTYFHEIVYLLIFRKYIEQLEDSFQSDKKNGTLHEDQYTFSIISPSVLLGMKNFSDGSSRETRNTYFIFSNFFSKNRAMYEIIRKNTVKQGRPKMTMWRMRIPCWIPKSTDTNTHSQYVTLIALSLQQWLQERASILRYTFIACLDSFVSSEVPPPILLGYIVLLQIV